ncbi:hypothetical protein Tco_1008164 [Tanacetum coccineum]
MGVFGGVEKVRALRANGVTKGSTLGVWFEVGGGMVAKEALEQALCLFKFWGFSSFNGQKLVHVVIRVESVVTHRIIFHSLVWRRRHESRLDLREEEGRGWGKDHNSDFDIVDDESNGESSIEVSNEAKTFVKLKNEDGANLFINVEKRIKTNYRKDVAKIWFIIEETHPS